MTKKILEAIFKNKKKLFGFAVLLINFL